MRSLDEINRLLVEAQAECAQLTARLAELLNVIRDLRQERATLAPSKKRHSRLVRSQLLPTNHPKKRRSPYSGRSSEAAMTCTSSSSPCLSSGRIETRIERESLLSFQLVTSCCTGRVEQEVPAFAGNRTRDDDEQVVF